MAANLIRQSTMRISLDVHRDNDRIMIASPRCRHKKIFFAYRSSHPTVIHRSQNRTNSPLHLLAVSSLAVVDWLRRFRPSRACVVIPWMIGGQELHVGAELSLLTDGNARRVQKYGAEVYKHSRQA
jgi:hypothetical protein